MPTTDEIKLINQAVAYDGIGEYGTFPYADLIRVLPSAGNDPDGRTYVNALRRNGFIDFTGVPFSNAQNGVHEFYTLNDRWRKLKRCENYEGLLKYERRQIFREAQNNQIQDRILREQFKFQEINNRYIVKQEELIESQKRTNESVEKTNSISKTTNILISIFTGAAALWYLRDVTKNILLDYYPKDATHLEKLSQCASNCLNIATALILCIGIFFVRRIYRVQEIPAK